MTELDGVSTLPRLIQSVWVSKMEYSLSAVAGDLLAVDRRRV